MGTRVRNSSREIHSSDSESKVALGSTSKKRNSRAGTRSVTTLSAVQLERKRANDREAQRAIRQRTKGNIERLECRIAELSNDRTAGAQRVKELEDEVAYLRDKLAQVNGGVGMSSDQSGRHPPHPVLHSANSDICPPPGLWSEAPAIRSPLSADSLSPIDTAQSIGRMHAVMPPAMPRQQHVIYQPQPADVWQQHASSPPVNTYTRSPPVRTRHSLPHTNVEMLQMTQGEWIGAARDQRPATAVSAPYAALGQHSMTPDGEYAYMPGGGPGQQRLGRVMAYPNVDIGNASHHPPRHDLDHVGMGHHTRVAQYHPIPDEPRYMPQQSQDSARPYEARGQLDGPPQMYYQNNYSRN